MVRRVLLEPNPMFNEIDMVEQYKKVYGPDNIPVSDADDILRGWTPVDGTVPDFIIGDGV